MLSRRSLLAALTVLVVAACGNPPQRPASHPSSPPAPTPTPGRPAPALLQVENSPDSRPHSGLQSADLVFEYLTEGGITRFTAVYFNPSGSTKIGPDRSARLVALRLVHSFGGVLFYSGASDHVLGMIWDQHLPNYDDRSDGGAYFSRDSSRQAPHNLYTTGDQMAQAIKKSGVKVTYDLPARGEPAGAPDAQVAHFAFQQTFAHSADYTYDPASKTYTYRNETGVETDAGNGNQPLKITNVVLLRVPHHGAGYTEDVNGQEGIDFDLQGQGPADVYTRGGHYAATWDLSDPNQPLKLVAPGGAPFTLPEGLTWFHLVDPDMGRLERRRMIAVERCSGTHNVIGLRPVNEWQAVPVTKSVTADQTGPGSQVKTVPRIRDQIGPGPRDQTGHPSRDQIGPGVGIKPVTKPVTHAKKGFQESRKNQKKPPTPRPPARTGTGAGFSPDHEEDLTSPQQVKHLPENKDLPESETVNIVPAPEPAKTSPAPNPRHLSVIPLADRPDLRRSAIEQLKSGYYHHQRGWDSLTQYLPQLGPYPDTFAERRERVAAVLAADEEAA